MICKKAVITILWKESFFVTKTMLETSDRIWTLQWNARICSIRHLNEAIATVNMLLDRFLSFSSHYLFHIQQRWRSCHDSFFSFLSPPPCSSGTRSDCRAADSGASVRFHVTAHMAKCTGCRSRDFLKGRRQPGNDAQTNVTSIPMSRSEHSRRWTAALILCKMKMTGSFFFCLSFSTNVWSVEKKKTKRRWHKAKPFLPLRCCQSWGKQGGN